MLRIERARALAWVDTAAASQVVVSKQEELASLSSHDGCTQLLGAQAIAPPRALSRKHITELKIKDMWHHGHPVQL